MNLMLSLKLKVDGSPTEQQVNEFVPKMLEAILKGNGAHVFDLHDLVACAADKMPHEDLKPLGNVTITDVHVSRER